MIATKCQDISEQRNGETGGEETDKKEKRQRFEENQVIQTQFSQLLEDSNEIKSRASPAREKSSKRSKNKHGEAKVHHAGNQERETRGVGPGADRQQKLQEAAPIK